MIEKKGHRARSHRRQNHAPLVEYVEAKLREDWPPEVVAYQVRADHPHDDRMRVSHEAIYRWVFLDAAQGGTLFRHLHCRHKHRRRQKHYGAGRRFILGRVGIEERPEVVAQRSRFGDWEGDLVLGRRRSGAIATHVERKSRYQMAALLSDRKAGSFNLAVIPACQDLPKHLCQRLRLDNGKEFSRFKDLETKAGLAVFFAAPCSVWQRGTNENTNGLLRFNFPKGTNFKRISANTMAKAFHRLNNRPRKCLGYRTPQEVYDEVRSDAFSN